MKLLANCSQSILTSYKPGDIVNEVMDCEIHYFVEEKQKRVPTEKELISEHNKLVADKAAAILIAIGDMNDMLLRVEVKGTPSKKVSKRYNALMIQVNGLYSLIDGSVYSPQSRTVKAVRFAIENRLGWLDQHYRELFPNTI